MAPSTGYVGRFAPTPSGPLHFGSLLTAIASFLDARAQAGTWILRVDDLDAHRVVRGAEAEILHSLERHALHWDRPLVRQSCRSDAYRDALTQLEQRQGQVFYCRCTRRETAASAQYSGTCRAVRRRPAEAYSVRIDTAAARGSFLDEIQGRIDRPLSAIHGDFIIWRRDGIAAYPLAVVVDDHLDAVTHVFRGADLLEETVNQVFLSRSLSWSPPKFAHLPLVLDKDGTKLSKHAGLYAIDSRFAAQNVASALQLLGFDPPALASPAELLEWAVGRWDRQQICPGNALSHFRCFGTLDLPPE